jgi:hypothetical protein
MEICGEVLLPAPRMALEWMELDWDVERGLRRHRFDITIDVLYVR